MDNVMDRPPKRMKRGINHSTATRIRYDSPPPRDEITAYLVEGRNRGHMRSRHTPLDDYVAQDRAFSKAEILKAAEEAARIRRRDSAVNSEAAAVAAAVEEKDIVHNAEEFEIKPELSSPKLPVRVAPAKTNIKLDEAVARAPSSFSTSPRSANTLTIAVKEASTPPEQADPLLNAPKRGSRRSSTRKRSDRGSSRDDLAIDGNAMLDPTRSTQGLQVTLYRDRSTHKWYEVRGVGVRPDWADDEKTESRAAPAKRRESTWLKRHE